jgi:hypothetical protein
MKLAFVAFVATILSLQPALAQFSVETEAGAVNGAELELLGHAQPVRNNDGDIIAGIIIGGIIGAIAADALDREDEGRFNNGRHHGPRYDGRGGRHNGGRHDNNFGRPRYRTVTCFAQNLRGQIFRVTGQQARNVQRRAVNKCYQQSASCRPMGCQVSGW